MKNKTILSLLLLSIVILSLNIVHAQTQFAAHLNISLLNQDPDPVEPGNYVDLRFKIENNGDEGVEDIILELIPEYPFSLEPGISTQKDIGSMRAHQVGVEGIIVKYRVRVDEKAIEGNNPIKLKYLLKKYATDPGTWIELPEFFIDIRSADAILEVASVDFDKIVPGTASIVNINFKNLADSLLKSIRVKLDFTGLPFAPIGSSNEKTILQLNAHEEKILDFTIMAEPDAESKVYKVPLNLVYQDNTGTKYNRTYTIGLIIGDEPDLSVILDQSEILKTGQAGKISIKFVNKGVTDIKFLNVKLKASKDYEIISYDEMYVGNVDSDDYETADFNIYVNRFRKSPVDLLVSLDYKDANNNDYHKDLTLKLVLYSSSEIKKFGLKKGNGFGGLFIFILIVGGGIYWYWRKRKKKKHHDEHHK